jgi:hypothetical protein
VITPLRTHIKAGDTGCLSSTDSFGIPLHIYLLNGSLVAAHAGDDTHALLRVLLKRDWIEESQLHVYKDQAAFQTIYDVLLQDGESMRLREAFYDRFRENLCRFIEAAADPSFEALEAVMIPNIQLTHETQALVEEALSVVERTHKTRNEKGLLLVQPGTRPALSAPEKKLLRLAPDSTPLQALVRQSPFESFQSWDLLSDMLERNVLEFVATETPPQKATLQEPPPTQQPNAAPRLSKNEAEEKIQVLNEVVSAFHQASDQLAGPGAGRAQLRLLLDGSPRQFALLFNGLELAEDGQVNATELVQRLRTRIGPERRNLLNAGVRDLIQRTLSMADESLDTPQMNALLERISGQESRLGW